MIDVMELVQSLKQLKGSDMHIKAGSVPYVRVNGNLQPTPLAPCSVEDLEKLAASLLPATRVGELEDRGETDFATSLPGVGRYRTSIVRQRGTLSIVLRRVLAAPPTFSSLGLPDTIAPIAQRRHGLILVTGPPDSGKSMTIASMINHINESSAVSIGTLEDPIEVLHADKKAFVNQREVGTDTLSYGSGLRRSLRHDSDVLYLDRIPDVEVMSMVLAAASSRLVLSTLPTMTAVATIQRVLDFFPANQARSVRQQLGAVLQAIISQRLLSRDDQPGRIAAFEILTMTQRVSEAIVGGVPDAELNAHITAGEYNGMQTLDQHLIELHRRRAISASDAIANAVSPPAVRLAVEGPQA